MKIIIWLILIAVAVAALLVWRYVFTLDTIEKLIEKSHPVPNISVDTFLAELASADSVEYLVFDTREPEEFQRSHLKAAIQVNPNINPEDFLKKYGDRIAGKKVVFYCSIGARSSVLAEKILQNAPDIADTVMNLRGGVFRWYNRGYPVYNTRGQANDVHPYNFFWGKLLKTRR